MNARDELQELWIGQPSRGNAHAGELLVLVQRKTRRFDLMIITRNLIESAAALFVAVFFGRYALVRAENPLERTGSVIVAAGACWIILYLLRHSQGLSALDPSQDLTSYTAALLARYDHQIHILRSARYWYLLPLYVGLLVINAGIISGRAHPWTMGWRDVAGPASYTAVFAVVWWLNEVYGVGKLRRERANLLAITARTTDLSAKAQ